MAVVSCHTARGEGRSNNTTKKKIRGRQKCVSKSRHHITAGGHHGKVVHTLVVVVKGVGHNNTAAHTWVVLVSPLLCFFFSPGIVVGTVGSGKGKGGVVAPLRWCTTCLALRPSVGFVSGSRPLLPLHRLEKASLLFVLVLHPVWKPVELGLGALEHRLKVFIRQVGLEPLGVDALRQRNRLQLLDRVVSLG